MKTIFSVDFDCERRKKYSIDCGACEDKQNGNNNNINTTQIENERKGDHSLIAFSNYTHFSNILSYCECVPNIFEEKKTPARQEKRKG